MEPFRRPGVRKPRLKGEYEMLQKVTTVVLLGIALSVAACNTVRGAARDVNSVANCTENTMNGNGCK
jgi:predicted small secreted protein